MMSVTSARVTDPFDWLEPEAWTCPGCAFTLVTKEGSPRCPRCGFREGDT